jgi:hypothetical protein
VNGRGTLLEGSWEVDELLLTCKAIDSVATHVNKGSTCRVDPLPDFRLKISVLRQDLSLLPSPSLASFLLRREQRDVSLSYPQLILGFENTLCSFLDMTPPAFCLPSQN